MQRKQADVEASLKRKGFKAHQGDHKYFTYYSLAGKKTRIFTKTSHGNKELDDFLLSQMGKQCALTKTDFGLLIDCPLDQEAYETKLIAQQLVESPPAKA